MNSQKPESNAPTEQVSAHLCWQAQRRDRILFFLIRLAVPLAGVGAVLYSSLDLLPVTLLILFSLIMLSRYLTTHDAPLRCLMDAHGCELILSSGRRLLVTPGFGFLSTHLQLLSVQDASRRRHVISAVAGISTADQQRQLRRLLLALPSLRRQDSV